MPLTSTTFKKKAGEVLFLELLHLTPITCSMFKKKGTLLTYSIL